MKSPVLEKKKERGRPSTYSREKIVERVTQLFWTHGYNDLSLNSISKEIGLNRSSFYNAFETKEALFLECMNHYLDESPTKLLSLHQDGQAVGPLMHKVLKKICELRASDKQKRGCLATNSFVELATNNTELGQTLLEKSALRYKGMARLVERAISQGELSKDDDPEIIANLLISFMNGLNMHAKKGASLKELTSMADVFLTKIGFNKTHSSNNENFVSPN